MPASASLQVATNVAVPMRDGTTLYADVYRPEGDGPFPAILQRTPYNKTLARTPLDPHAHNPDGIVRNVGISERSRPTCPDAGQGRSLRALVAVAR